MSILSKWFKGLRGKLLMMVAVPITIMSILSGVALYGLNSLKSDIDLFSKKRLPITTSVWYLRTLMNATYRFAWLAVAKDNDKEARKKALAATTEKMNLYKEEFEKLEKFDLLEKTKTLLKKVDVNWKQSTEILERAIVLLEKNNPADNLVAKQVMGNIYALGTSITADLAEVVAITEKRNTEISEAAEKNSNSIKFILITTVILSSFGLLIIGIWIASRLAALLTGITKSIAEAGAQVNTGSVQLSTASQQLSGGATEAAASLEETVSSIEELSSMVKLNADHAKEAAALSEGSKRSAEDGETEIKNLIVAMTNISQSSKKIEEIINVIDDIAFQTNLLALNAAVEAARAGEQGKGFAVVAEAVRNLAQRSAAAAKDITTLIKDSVAKTENGSKTADQSGAVLKTIVTAVKKVADLNNEISSASQEQANGISQIGKAMNQLDQATQSNASAAEEVAASSEEMSAQATSLQDLVNELAFIVDGAGSQVAHTRSAGSGPGRHLHETRGEGHPTKKTHLARVIPHPTAAEARHRQSSKKPKVSNSEAAIPFDEVESRSAVGNTDGF